MPNAPYVNPPVNPQVQSDADGIYFGWMGLAQDATFRANMALIIRDGMIAALTTPSVIAANTLGIKNALIDPAVIAANTLGIKNALIDPAVITAAADAIEQAIADPVTAQNLIDIFTESVGDGVYDAVEDLIAAGLVPSRTDWRRALALIALASVSVRKSTFLKATSPADFADLKSRVTATENDVLQP